ncbi:MAG: hypothetical protein IKK44_04750 [Clostridium sp.]|nr:hypothetical protein [Clostridium sp.]
MGKSLRFLWTSARLNLSVSAGFAAVVTLGTWATGGVPGTDNAFSLYFGLFPMMALIMMFLFAFSLCTTELNLALTFGARRQDFFRAVQGMLAIYAVAFWAMQRGMAALPNALDWEKREIWNSMLSLGGMPWWLYPLICLAVLSAGCLCGLVYVRARRWGVAIICGVCLLGVAAVVVLLIAANHWDGTLWDGLPALLAAGMALVFVGSECLLWRTVRRAVVK